MAINDCLFCIQLSMLLFMKTFFKLKTRMAILMGVFISILVVLAYAEDADETFPAQFNLTNLNGKNGFTVSDANSSEYIGFFVSRAGDVNKDGVDDILICAGKVNDNNIFAVYVVFGSKEPWPTVVDLYDLNGKNGFVINGQGDQFSVSATRAGDVNGDGIDDILIGAPSANEEIGQSYVVFGKENWSPALNLTDLNGENGFYINGINAYDFSGGSLSGAGDVNGDGIDDFLIGAYGANNKAGQSYVIFGTRKPWPIAINLADLDGTNGFTMNGINPNDSSGFSVSMVGDVNGDGIDDLLIGASWVNDKRGQSYIVFGSKLWPTVINLGSLNGTNGFAINGINPNYYSGILVAKSNDINGDGIADFLIGTVSYLNNDIGQIYLVFGSKNPWPATMRLADLNGTNGFIINGFRGTPVFSASGAGDVNADGIADILIGAYGIESQEGQTYVIFGKKGLWSIVTNVANLDGTNGFTINGINKNDQISCSVSSAGDVNADGVDDILIGALNANNDLGQSYIVFGERELSDD